MRIVSLSSMEIEPQMDWAVYGGIIGGATLLGIAAYVYRRPVDENEPTASQIRKNYQQSLRKMKNYLEKGGTRKKHCI